MALDLRDCTFFGPALPEPFVKFQLEAELNKRKLLPKATGDEGRALQDRWDVYRRKLRALGEQGGDRRVASHVIEPLTERLGYATFESQAEVITREGPEDGGWLFTSEDGRKLRAWSVGLGTDLDAPSRRGRAYRFSPSRVAQRVLLASGERVGLLTDGEELRLLLCDPARPDSHIAVRLDRSGGWRAARGVPDSYRVLLALASPDGVEVVPDLAEAARLAQSTVTKKLRLQARRAIEGFLQELLDHPENAAVRAEWTDAGELARALWREGLILVYRLLFVFKLESSADPARAFSFAATSLWRNTYSPNTALARLVRRVLDDGADSGGFLESGLRALWRMFAEGMSSSELEIRPLGGMLFGRDATPLLDRLTWGERGVARLLDALLWTPGDGKTERERVHYGALDVEDLGRVYEALLELEPGITTEAMCRLRRAKLEVVVPVAQGAPYRTDVAPSDLDDGEDSGADDTDDGNEDEAPKRRGKAAAGSKTKVQFIEEIPTGRFFLRVGLGRKASGSYYTPHPFVRFLVQETLEPQLAERSPKEDPHPGRILELKVLDPAMGSGHFLVEACRYLGEALYEACRLCDELAVQAEEQAEKVAEAEREALLARAAELRKRVEDLPDPEDELVAYLPSRAAEGEESGLSQRKAEALCRRLVAVHCLYGVDKNPLAVELAKLSLWLESYAEGLPLTFMDHRLIQGDSLTGPFFEHLLTYPKSGEKLDDLFAQGLTERLQATLAAALVHVRDLEASVGKDVADLEQKRAAKEKLDAALAPLKTLAAAWSGGVMLGDDSDDAGYQALARAVAAGEDVASVLEARPRLREMRATGGTGVAFELAFPEVFAADPASSPGFHAVVGNPPWDRIEVAPQDYFGSLDFSVLEAPNEEARKAIMERLAADPVVAAGWETLAEGTRRDERVADRLYDHQKVRVAGKLTLGRPDTYRLFVERWVRLAATDGGATGWLVPSSFHSNEGATGVRRLYLTATSIISCFSFENRRKLFDIDSRFKFVLLVAQRSASGTSEFVASFYLHDPAVLFSPDDRSRQVGLSRSIVREITGDHESFPEVRTHADLGLALAQARTSVTTWGQFLADAGVKTAFGVELHRNPDFALSLPVEGPTAAIVAWADEHAWQHLPLHAGKTIFQYTDEFDASPTNMVRTTVAAGTRHWGASTPGYRLAFRMKAASTNERSMIAVLITPGFVCEQTLAVETQPLKRPNRAALLALSIANSFMFDWQVRQRITTSLSNYLLAPVPLPSVREIA
ncbi:MAG: N-6 DNA methylase, partial [Myxococcales bacterium]|nr:N-6 DNA methylase [Myxococcales bacterium]